MYNIEDNSGIRKERGTREEKLWAAMEWTELFSPLNARLCPIRSHKVLLTCYITVQINKNKLENILRALNGQEKNIFLIKYICSNNSVYKKAGKAEQNYFIPWQYYGMSASGYLKE